MLILLPSTYNSRPAWEVFGEQEGGQARPALYGVTRYRYLLVRGYTVVDIVVRHGASKVLSYDAAHVVLTATVGCRCVTVIGAARYGAIFVNSHDAASVSVGAAGGRYVAVIDAARYGAGISGLSHDTACIYATTAVYACARYGAVVGTARYRTCAARRYDAARPGSSAGRRYGTVVGAIRNDAAIVIC